MERHRELVEIFRSLIQNPSLMLLDDLGQFWHDEIETGVFPGGYRVDFERFVFAIGQNHYLTKVSGLATLDGIINGSWLIMEHYPTISSPPPSDSLLREYEEACQEILEGADLRTWFPEKNFSKFVYLPGGNSKLRSKGV